MRIITRVGVPRWITEWLITCSKVGELAVRCLFPSRIRFNFTVIRMSIHGQVAVLIQSALFGSIAKLKGYSGILPMGSC
jgi:hypothetical protein